MPETEEEKWDKVRHEAYLSERESEDAFGGHHAQSEGSKTVAGGLGLAQREANEAEEEVVAATIFAATQRARANALAAYETLCTTEATELVAVDAWEKMEGNGVYGTGQSDVTWAATEAADAEIAARVEWEVAAQVWAKAELVDLARRVEARMDGPQ